MKKINLLISLTARGILLNACTSKYAKVENNRDSLKCVRE